MIYKVQLSLMTNEGYRQVMIYNEDRSQLIQMDATPEMVKFCKGRNKLFAKGKYENGNIVLNKVVKDRNW